MALLMRALRLIVALLALASIPAAAADVLVVQSARNAAYREALGGFKDGCKATARTVVLSDYAEVDVVRLVKEEQPRLVLAVGDAAFAASRKVGQVPVVGLLTLNLNLAAGAAGPVGGVGVMPAPERYLELFRKLGAKRVGVVHDPARTGHYVKRARQAAREAGVELIVREVRGGREVPGALERLKGAVDALWMLPDATAVTAEAADAWFLFSVANRVPLVTFSEQYLAKGAAVSLDVDRADLGRQAAAIANGLLDGSAARPSAVDARKARPNANPTVGRNLGLDLSDVLK